MRRKPRLEDTIRKVLPHIGGEAVTKPGWATASPEQIRAGLAELWEALSNVW